ncbi:hypothetical protein CRYUN_Cryun05aG0045300 [Craigia yunnanensis]
MVLSSRPFARKFKRNDPVLDKIHRELLKSRQEKLLGSGKVSGRTFISKDCNIFTQSSRFTVVQTQSSEYVLAVSIHGISNVSLKSLLVSKEYVLAMVFSLVEYFFGVLLFPGLKEYLWVSNLGLAMVVIGEIVRKLAIVTAGRSFTHLIKVHHEDHHKLVTKGVYGFFRHPSYCGFLIWSVGTQIMLCNPISTIGFAVVIWQFFAKRIPYEEYFLRQFFGADYEEYALRVPSGVPFVK